MGLSRHPKRRRRKKMMVVMVVVVVMFVPVPLMAGGHSQQTA